MEYFGFIDVLSTVHLISFNFRNALVSTVEGYLETAFALKNEVGDFMAGFDLVGQEDKGKPLIDFVPTLLEKLEGKDLKVRTTVA